MGFAGAGQVLVAMSDPDEPAPAMFLPILAALGGGAQVLLAHSRLWGGAPFPDGSPAPDFDLGER